MLFRMGKLRPNTEEVARSRLGCHPNGHGPCSGCSRGPRTAVPGFPPPRPQPSLSHTILTPDACDSSERGLPGAPALCPHSRPVPGPPHVPVTERKPPGELEPNYPLSALLEKAQGTKCPARADPQGRRQIAGGGGRPGRNRPGCGAPDNVLNQPGLMAARPGQCPQRPGLCHFKGFM